MSINDKVFEKLLNIERILTEQNLLKKDVLTFNEASIYIDVSHSHLYKMTSTGIVNCFKPNGKKIYFNRKDLDKWRLSNKQTSNREVELKADNFQINAGRAEL